MLHCVTMALDCSWFLTLTIISLATGKFELNFRYLIFPIIQVIDGGGIFCELSYRWMSLNLTDDKSVLVPSGNKPLPEPMLT